MQDAAPPPRLSSRVRTGMRLLAWFLPGMSAPGFLFLAFMFTYGAGHSSTLENLIMFGLLGGVLVVAVGCALLDAIIRLPPPGEDPAQRPKRLILHIVAFTLAQIPLVPLLGMGTATACSAAFGL